MYKLRLAAGIFLVSGAVVVFGAPAALAQTGDTAASTSTQATKGQRKSERRAARAKRSAELKDLEKNGYQPGNDQTNYPQNIQDAEKKSAAAKSKAASAP